MSVASPRFPRKGFALAIAAALGVAWWLGKIPAFVIGFYGAMSVFAFCLYWRDKAAAQRGDWRTSEKALHFAAVFGGWPGALVAQDVFPAQVEQGVVPDRVLVDGGDQLRRHGVVGARRDALSSTGGIRLLPARIRPLRRGSP